MAFVIRKHELFGRVFGGACQNLALSGQHAIVIGRVGAACSSGHAAGATYVAAGGLTASLIEPNGSLVRARVHQRPISCGRSRHVVSVNAPAIWSESLDPRAA